MPDSLQIRVSDEEKQRLIQRIENDFHSASQATGRWQERCRSWMQKWENRVSPAGIGDETKPNHTIPLVQWQCFQKLARDMQSILGDDAEITARAVGPSDAAKVRKVGRYMTARVFDQMEITNPLITFEFRRILFGHSVAHRPWYRREFDVLDDYGMPRRVWDYEGPGFFPLEPDDFVVPAERGVCDLQEFSWVGHRCRETVDELRRKDGTEYQGTSDPEFVRRAMEFARTSGTLSDWSLLNQNLVREERERSEGIDYDNPDQGGRGLWIWWWYGYWRPSRRAGRAPEFDDLERSLPYEADWRVGYIPGMREIVCIQDLLQLYPRMRRRRPFVESTLIKDGTYRPKGFGALLEDLEDDATQTSRLFAAAGELSVWPIIFFQPGSGFDPKAFTVEPGKAYPTQDPNGVRVINIAPNLQFGLMRQQDILSHAERVTGITDQSMGRASGRPNEPRTATGQIALLQSGNVRAWLDAAVLREDTERIIQDFWEMEVSLGHEETFFRVTEQEAGGLFEVKQGGAVMTPEEFAGRMDFKLKFATTVYAKEAKKAQALAFYQVSTANPIVATNPAALWSSLYRLAQEFGVDDFEAIVPKPPEVDLPLNPNQEWSKMLEGEEVEVHPQDHDEMHIAQHAKQIDQERQAREPDVQAVNLGIRHLMKHKEQQRTKALMQAQVAELTQAMGDPMNPVGQQMNQSMSEMELEAQAQGGEGGGGMNQDSTALAPSVLDAQRGPVM